MIGTNTDLWYHQFFYNKFFIGFYLHKIRKPFRNDMENICKARIKYSLQSAVSTYCHILIKTTNWNKCKKIVLSLRRVKFPIPAGALGFRTSGRARSRPLRSGSWRADDARRADVPALCDRWSRADRPAPRPQLPRWHRCRGLAPHRHVGPTGAGHGCCCGYKYDTCNRDGEKIRTNGTSSTSLVRGKRRLHTHIHTPAVRSELRGSAICCPGLW
mgnify:CR=1 FL=1